MADGVKVSLCMIVRDEAEFIVGCLESVRDAVDEMVVVDTGSVDGTPELARQAGADVYAFEWRDDFAAARNASIAHAKGEWVLILDADERLAPGGARGIRQAVVRNDFDCGFLAVHNASRLDASAEEVLSGQARLDQAALQPRLLRRTFDLAFHGTIHEHLQPWFAQRANRTRTLRAHVVHLGYVDEVQKARAKTDRNVRLLEERARLEPQNCGIYGYLAQQYLFMDQMDRAREAADAGWALLERAPEWTWPGTILLTVMRAQLQLQAGDARGALDTARVAERRVGSHPDLDVLRGAALAMLAQQASPPEERRAQLGAAAEAYRSARDQRRLGFSERCVPGSAVWKGLGIVALLRGQFGRAHQYFEAALAEGPGDRQALLGKAQALAAGGRSEEALALIEPLLDETPDGWFAAADAAERMGQIDDMMAFLRRARECTQAGAQSLWSDEEQLALNYRLLAYLGEPAAGPGAVGAACALLAGEAPTRLPVEMDARERSDVLLLVGNLLRLGREELVARLLEPGAERALPGVRALARKAARELGIEGGRVSFLGREALV